ncbi:UbiH/UbiF family hydroxylase [Chitinivorax sp. B]|uniref:UbiH/UbiF family hydroxylase n=1 Tax=Chitinivorax sp. B TaxID=2502235 RepID=UPI0032D584B2
MMQHDFDVAIVGGGLVGTSLALALANSRLRVVLVEGRKPTALPASDSWDSRIYAISPGSQQFLEELGAWQHMAKDRLGPVSQMLVRGDAHDARLAFSADDVRVPQLACILENRLLQDALWQAVQAAENVSIICPAEPAQVELGGRMANLTLAGGQTLTTQLVVGADGANSWVRSQAGISAAPRLYQQKGVVANFLCEKPHGQIARQWFFPDGILAWLPLPGNRMSMVWSTWDAKADELAGLDPTALCERVAAAGGHELGTLTLITPAAVFPLRLLHLDRIVAPRLALIGDAAHNVHPLAGQGVNLGFQDARTLARVLKSAVPGEDLGEHLLLRRYERARKEDVLAMQVVTDGLQRLFNNDNSLLGWLRNTGLAMTDRLGPIKHRLIRHALG